MSTTSRWIRSLQAIILVTFFVSAGCSSGPKPKELIELETHLGDPNLPKFRQSKGATKYLSEARQYERMAKDAWNDGNRDDASEYALLGSLRVQTAKAIYERSSLQADLEASNSAVAQANKQLNDLSTQRDSLRKEVADLQVARNKAKRTVQQRQNAQRTNELRHQQLSAGTPSPLTPEQRAQLTQALSMAKAAQQRAISVKADQFAPATYQPAKNRLSNFETLINNGTAAFHTLTELNSIQQDFEKSYQTAKPLFDNENEKSNPALRRSRILTEAQSLGNSTTIINSSPQGVRIILVGFFAGGGSTIDSTHQRHLSPIIKLAKSFDDFQIVIDGHTSKSNDATANLGTSQVRAQNVQRVFVDAGIPRSSISTRGRGQGEPYLGPATDRRNDRIEIQFNR